jgi:hypothetical protein
VLAAFQRARTLFPFPILGIDTDNGGEFLNEEVMAFCEKEQITFTRGRPYQKRDQCNALAKEWCDCAQVVGYDRLVGEYASAATHRTLPCAATVCQLLQNLR